MTKKIIYIMSDNRSGSTLLDQLLGAHSSVTSLGEVQHLPAYVFDDRDIYNPVHPLVCSCGDPVPECAFWNAVEEKLGRPLGSLQLKVGFYDRREPRNPVGRLGTRIIQWILYRRPKLATAQPFRSLLRASRVSRDSFDMFDAIFAVTGAKLLVDSSKDAFRMRFLYEDDPSRLFVIMLGRDFRGTVHSKMKRGRTLLAAIDGWTNRMNKMKLLADTIPAEQVIRVRYEDLCADPRGQLRKICSTLGIEFTEKMLTRPAESIHHLGGSPSKFDPSRRAIVLDTGYLTAFSPEELRVMKDIAGDIAAEWGYE